MGKFAPEMLAYYLILFGTGVLIAYSYRSVHILTHKMLPKYKWLFRIIFLFVSIFIYATTSYFAINRDEYRAYPMVRNYTIVGAVTLSVTLLSICIFQLLADLVLLGRHVHFRTSGKKAAGATMPRRTFMNTIALSVGGLMLGSVLWGTTKGKFGWRILENKLSFDNLPKAFDGLRIAQISDLHLGSFENNFEPLEEAVRMVNELKPDYIFFTGDLVNESPEEAESWIPVFQKLEAKHGKYAILGNHDYGWGRGGKLTEEKKTENANGVAEIIRRMDFNMLLNEHDILEKDGEKIGLVGVENWGYTEEGWFPTRGDYKKSVETMEDVPFKILLSHDPTHWDHHILSKENVDLTLSGHTHGGQMGVSIPGLVEISAAKLFYKRYAGLYKEADQYLYVNRGMGYLIFPGRVGMPPEITLHELRRA
ncbi:MAG: metallophosphoesterase [Flavobacteriales bacterium]|nr:metallophosphoesterase [Flavobacteriales bacterium]